VQWCRIVINPDGFAAGHCPASKSSPLEGIHESYPRPDTCRAAWSSLRRLALYESCKAPFASNYQTQTLRAGDTGGVQGIWNQLLFARIEALPWRFNIPGEDWWALRWLVPHAAILHHTDAWFSQPEPDGGQSSRARGSERETERSRGPGGPSPGGASAATALCARCGTPATTATCSTLGRETNTRTTCATAIERLVVVDMHSVCERRACA